jgi:CII-binding regulator of phage lambda lysogenization HflD
MRKCWLRRVRRTSVVGKTRRQLTVGLITELEMIDKKTKATDKDLRELVIALDHLARQVRPERAASRSI